MGFWEYMIKKDAQICSGIDWALGVKASLNPKVQHVLKRMDKLPKAGPGREALVILNGPSLKEQDITQIHENVDLVFVNRGFMHQDFARVKPRYHVFVDPKMLTGEWSLTWIDDIVAMVPDITIVLPVTWAFRPEFKRFIDNNTKIHWIPDFKKCYCVGVSGNCFDFLASQDYKTIYFTGFDANGLPLEMLNVSNSHFYGKNEENLTKTSKEYVRDLYMFSRHFADLNKMSNLYKKRNIRLVNLTQGGLLDMFEREHIRILDKR
ncbi:hypothetical protein B0I21_10455 [Sphingobacterium paludis]|uniref:DUF115 domain-containing protein n=2 Tax=Sphingobacterium paludis TaxID=1476465 RepID=A0A4R7CYQ6_9SPHI|nr:hypothetical protein B0I21_10455 [Sphingobacterium paludis]